ncbi:MAG: tryptophan synthase subunit alpha [Gammaproteobacteria bacterium]|nr:tryptophan synthase subunit alpha [Gammaproteobacteria bacterium]
MSRLHNVFTELKDERAALVTFVTGGDPQPAVTVPLLHALVEAGADVLEVGIPFSDPMADGPVIQMSHQRALVHGTTLTDVLAMVASFRQQNTRTPVVLMGYVNPVEAMGYDVFARACAGAGVDGVILVDLPPEEAGDWLAAARQAGVDRVFLLAPTSPPARIARVGEVSSGFIYYVALKGVTGAAHLDIADVESRLAVVRAHTRLPVGVGFGVQDAASARALGAVADAVIVGSALIRRLAAHEGGDAIAEARSFVAGLRAALPSRR